ncbi:MAG: adenylosuccinate lyase [Deltaproteobacteria bacterium]|jgi:adenylosuccinate lyase|nr:adenylosuccinate lyase [Deltaproteobacteria bacterium]
MLKRYSREIMSSIWTLDAQYAAWLRVELAVVRAQAELGLVPEREAREIEAKAAWSAERIASIEAEVNHDVVAFVTCVEESVGDAARFLHFGLTSSDVLDTALALRMGESAAVIREDLLGLMEALRGRALEHSGTLIMGRSHGIHAEPTTLGVKFASFHSELGRRLAGLDRAAEGLRTGKIAGPVGNYSSRSLSPELERRALGMLGLVPCPVSSQVVPRDIHAAYFQELALAACAVERLAVEVRHLARTEVGEVTEAFGKGQKGSSAMPHKRNPILSENLTGLARMVRAYASAALEDVVLWHERDISHSSVERTAFPDALILADFMLARARTLVAGLVVNRERIAGNIAMTGGLYNSQELLLALCRSGLGRSDAYRLVQAEALRSADGGGDFRTLVLASPGIRERLSEDEVEECFRPGRFSRWAGEIVSRSLKA